PEAVRAENVVVTGHPRADEVGHHVVPVARGDVGAARVAQLAGDVGLAVVGGGLEQALALDLQRLTAQVAPARHGPDAGAHSPVLGEDLAGVQRPRHPDTGGEQLHPRAVALGRGDAVDALEDALDVHVLRLGRLVHRLVVHREVVHDVRV